MATITRLDVNGNWTTAADWSGGTLSGCGDDAVLGGTAGYTVQLTTPIAVASITINASSATLSVSDPGGTETVNGAFSNSGSLYVDAGGSGGSTLTIGGLLSNSN